MESKEKTTVKKILLNRYFIFYFLYLIYLIGGALPAKYSIVPVAYYKPPDLFGEFILGLFYVLPLYFISLIIIDFLKRKFKVIVINIIIVIFLFLSFQLITRKILKPLYEKKWRIELTCM